MTDTLTIPDSHWTPIDLPRWREFIPSWEKQLRENIAAQPDPAKRFEEWLTRKSELAHVRGTRLIFIEQPYLAWAEAVERVIAATEKDTRESIAYYITHPERD